ncbi:unnamed protein product [Moneuplotes crassus]|uniref:Uncharacterized protein n=1 Tax=Euplotes crassus TaxID=5936 RepID=A0AAD1Y505_EUPCR|nr:unnamed protein product [Moneuplotes crassus]
MLSTSLLLCLNHLTLHCPNTMILEQKKAPKNTTPILDNPFEEEKDSAPYHPNSGLQFSLFRRLRDPLRERIHHE